MSEFSGKDKGFVQYDSQGLIVVPKFNSGNEAPVTPAVKPTTEQEARFTDVHDLVGKDMLRGRKYTIPSRSSDKVYIMKPTGEIRNGQIVMSGPDVSGNNVWERTVTPSEYVLMYEKEEARDRAVAEHVGGGVVDAVEVAANAGVEAPGRPEQSVGETIKTQVDKIIADITTSIDRSGYVDPASTCGQRAEEIKTLLRSGIGISDEATVAILNQAINVLEQGSTASMTSDNSRSTVAALSNARTILRGI